MWMHAKKDETLTKRDNSCSEYKHVIDKEQEFKHFACQEMWNMN